MPAEYFSRPLLPGQSPVCVRVERAPCRSLLTAPFLPPHSPHSIPALTPFNEAVLGLNFATLACVILGQIIFGQRDNYMINVFDSDDTQDASNLKDELRLYPQIKKQLDKFNLSNFWYSLVLVRRLPRRGNTVKPIHDALRRQRGSLLATARPVPHPTNKPLLLTHSHPLLSRGPCFSSP